MLIQFGKYKTPDNHYCLVVAGVLQNSFNRLITGQSRNMPLIRSDKYLR